MCEFHDAVAWPYPVDAVKLKACDMGIRYQEREVAGQKKLE
jgi:hypothetical protein